MKEIRMSGLSDLFSTQIQDRRIKELKCSLAFRRINVAKNTIGILPQILGSVTAFTIFALVLQTDHGSQLDPATAFTALSLISLLSSPIFLFVFALPQFTASIGCFDRIQEYLVSEGAIPSRPSIDIDTFSTKRLYRDSVTKQLSDAVPLQSTETSVQSSLDETFVTLDSSTFSFNVNDQPVLKNISVSLRKSSFSMLIGPVGCGKSALLLAILGELHLRNGTLQRAKHINIGYCAQEPWLPNLSIRQIIQSTSSYDMAWYRTVIHACALDLDLSQFPHGDETVVGSTGSRLSSGQKQRLSLARALYSRNQLLLVDDVTSGLDPVTEQTIVRRVFGPQGLCREHGLSIVMATHKSGYHPP